ncbi:unnamed protein product [Cuscuta epithymum]|uniref:CCHC-type domain-containing protein n=1 Tax=Cuscuta epithymum TaxID=186058 RepID=A0AAV0DP03_9ASTE|nr:unnamed protein product [Cuscuta epithymum]
MADTMEELYAKLNLEEEDAEEIDVSEAVLSPAQVGPSFLAVGRILTDKQVKFPYFRDTMADVWRPGRGVHIRDLGERRYLFQFFHEVDINRIMADTPWSFDNNLLILSRLEATDNPMKISLSHENFWVQAYNLPMSFFTEKMAKLIGDYVGQFVHADENNFKGGRKLFMRIRVRMDVQAPLKKRMRVRNGTDVHWVDLKYERLPHFCFICGKLGHVDRFCPKWLDGFKADQEKPFGVWLRAGGRKGGGAGGSMWLVDEEGRALGKSGEGRAESLPKQIITNIYGGKNELGSAANSDVELEEGDGRLIVCQPHKEPNTGGVWKKRKACGEGENQRELMNEDKAEDLPKNVLEAGPGFQARLTL